MYHKAGICSDNVGAVQPKIIRPTVAPPRVKSTDLDISTCKGKK